MGRFRTPTKLGGLPNLAEEPDENDDDDDGHDDPDDDLHLHVLPELLPLDPDGRPVELLGALLQPLGPVLQGAQLAVALQHLLHVLLHDVLHLVHLAPGRLQVGVGRRAALIAGCHGYRSSSWGLLGCGRVQLGIWTVELEEDA